MTEAEWLACTDPFPMEDFLERKGKTSDRQWRLWACACNRRVWHLLVDERSRRAVEVAEAFADGLADARQRRAAYRAAQRAWLKLRNVMDQSFVINGIGDQALHDATRDPYYASIAAGAVCQGRSHGIFARHSAACAVLAFEPEMARRSEAGDAERAAQANLLRDIFGNPYRPVDLDPKWLSWNHGTLPALARHIYEDRALHDLPILADALGDAGCTDAAILDHCRQPGEHVRGCWVVDLILGQS